MIRRALPVALTVTALAVAAVGAATFPPPAAAQKSEAEPGSKRPRAGRPWDQQADRIFRLGKGVGAQVMTEEEWQEHQSKMRSMSPDERKRYRQDVHDKIMERARDKGISVPEAPARRGSRGAPDSDRSPAEPDSGRSPGRRAWDQQAEQAFRLGKGVSSQIMTEEEWQEHQAKMRDMSPDERKSYREEVHDKLAKRARERGITLPETPAPRGSGAPAGEGKSRR